MPVEVVGKAPNTTFFGHFHTTRQAPYAPEYTTVNRGLWWGTAEFDTLKQIAEALIEQTGAPWNERTAGYDSARWLSARLTELLPFDPATKHSLLATHDPVERLRRIQPLVRIENAS